MSLNSCVILPGQTIGIIGGGQLGRMMALSAKAMGFRIAVLDPTTDCPCAQVADWFVQAAYNDLDAIAELAEISDVITYEFENIDAQALKWLSDHAYVPQGTRLLEATQNRMTEKAAIAQAGGMVAPYEVIHGPEEIYDKIERLGYPAVLKTARGGYDGKGQFVLRTPADVAKAAELTRLGPCVLEQWVPFSKEISVIVARNASGQSEVMPVGENIHRDNILHQTIVPARIAREVAEEAKKLALSLAESFGLIGTLAVEMFVTEDGAIFINELAPRPHNSGHYSIEACETSQFEQHIRAICGWPLATTKLLSPAVMVNLLGEHVEPMLQQIPHTTDWKIHLYGKKVAVKKRKMGHVTLLRETPELALVELKKSRIWSQIEEVIGG